MIEFLRLFLTFVVVVNPSGNALRWNALSAGFGRPQRRGWALAAIATAATLLVPCVLLGDEILDFFDVSVSSWQSGAGLLLIIGLVPTLLLREPFNPEPLPSSRWKRAIEAGRLALSVATPAVIVVSAFYGADRGTLRSLGALAGALAILAAAVLASRRLETGTTRLPLREGGRVLSVIAVVIGIDLLIDGIERV
ncbi:MAG: MarC family protein [Dehalococcoidia bacterium]